MLIIRVYQEIILIFFLPIDNDSWDNHNHNSTTNEEDNEDIDYFDEDNKNHDDVNNFDEDNVDDDQYGEDNKEVDYQVRYLQVGPAATVNYEAAGASDDWAKVMTMINDHDYEDEYDDV